MAKKIVRKEIVKKDQPKQADIPKKSESSGIKDKIETRAKEIKSVKRPKRLRSMADTWDTVESLDEKHKDIEGLKILIYGIEKCGKSKLSQESLNFNGFEGNNRIVPPGYPVYVIDTEVRRALETARQNFKDKLIDGTLKIKQCNIRDPVTKRTDKASSLRTLTDFALSVLDEEQGTLVIDTVTDFGDWLYAVLVTEVLPEDYGFDEWGSEIKKVAPVQYAWKRKENVDILRALRDTKMNVVLIGQGKPEYEKPKKMEKGKKSDVFNTKQTGAIIADVDAKTGHWVDIICLLEKDKQSGKRKITITDSAFEDKLVEMIEIEDDISITGIVNAIKDKL